MHLPRDATFLCLAIIFCASSLQAGKVDWVQYVGQAVQDNIWPSLPNDYISLSGSVLAQAHPVPDGKATSETFQADYYESTDSKNGESLDDHVGDADEAEEDGMTAQDQLDAVIENIPPRPYLLGRGWFGGESLVNEIDELLWGCDRLWAGHINAGYQICVSRLVIAEMTVMHDCYANGTYSKEFVQGVLWNMDQRMSAAGQRHLAQRGKPAIHRALPDPWGAWLQLWDSLDVQSADPKSCTDCNNGMNSKPKEDILAMKPEENSIKVANKAKDVSMDQARKPEDNTAKRDMKPEEATDPIELILQGMFSWMWDTRANAIEAWYQELCALHRKGDTTGKELHLKACVRGVNDDFCHFLPTWMRTAFSWTGSPVLCFDRFVSW